MGLRDFISNMSLKVNYDGSMAEKGLERLKQLVIGAFSIYALKQLFDYSKGLAIMGAQANTAERSFNRMVTSLGGDSKRMVSDMKVATLGMVDDSDLMGMAFQGLMKQINFKDMKVAMEYATKYALSTGQNFNEVYQQIMMSFSRNTSRGLASVGIMVHGSKDVVKDGVSQMQQKMKDLTVDMNDPILKAQQLETAFNEQKETIGKALIPAYSAWLGFLTDEVVPLLDEMIAKIDRFVNPQKAAQKDYATQKRIEDLERINDLTSALNAAQGDSFATMDREGNMAKHTVAGARYEIKQLKEDVTALEKQLGLPLSFGPKTKKNDRTLSFKSSADEESRKKAEEEEKKFYEDHLGFVKSTTGIENQLKSEDYLADKENQEKRLEDDKKFYEEHLGFTESAIGIENQLKSEDYLADVEGIKERNARILEEEKKLYEERVRLAENWVGTWSNITHGLETLSNAQTDREIRNLDKQHLSEKQYAKRKAAIEEEALEKRRQFARMEQTIAVAEAIINVTKAATGTFADTPGGIILRSGAMIAAGLEGAMQVAIIEAQNFATGRGLIDILSRGRNSDNIQARVGRGEYIMPADKTAENIDELEAMRKGTTGTRSTGTVIQNFYSVPLETVIQCQRDATRKNLMTTRY
jgi:hypothetical protein